MKKVWIIVISVAVGLVSGPIYVWHQATQMPAWYANRAIAVSNVIDLGDQIALKQAEQTVNDKFSTIQPTADGKAEVELTGSDLNALLASRVARVAKAQNLTPVVKQVSTAIANGKLESGAVINMTDLPGEALNQKGQDTVLRLAKAFPGLSDREVYVGIEGTPIVQNGQLKLNGAHLRIGNLRFSVTDVAQRLGVSEAVLQEKIDQQLSLQQAAIESVDLTNNAVKVRGTLN